MSHRTKSRDRCPRCYVRRVLCVCSLLPRFNVETRLLILIHKRESKRPTNTGRLLTLVLPNSEIRIRGDKENPMETSGLVADYGQTLLLYPSRNAVELTPEFVSRLKKPVTLIIPDGSWRQAGKVMKREPTLRDVPHVKLGPGPAPRYRLRQETKQGGLSTFGAVARAMGILEEMEIQHSLESFFDILAERILWSRAKLRAEDCETPIPIAAIESHHGNKSNSLKEGKIL